MHALALLSTLLVASTASAGSVSVLDVVHALHSPVNAEALRTATRRAFPARPNKADDQRAMRSYLHRAERLERFSTVLGAELQELLRASDQPLDDRERTRVSHQLRAVERQHAYGLDEQRALHAEARAMSIEVSDSEQTASIGRALQSALRRALAKPRASGAANELSRLFVALADDEGRVDLAKVKRAYGPATVTFVKTLIAHEQERFPPARVGLRPDVRKALPTDVHDRLVELTGEYTPKMATFDALVARTAPQRPLAGFVVFGIQHILGSNHSLFDALVKSGVERGDLHIRTKYYSRNDELADWMNHRGIEIDRYRDRSIASDDGIVAALRHQLASTSKKIMLVDDGGKLIRLAQEHFPTQLHRFVAVEQTERGHLELEDTKLGIPVVSVARARIKKGIESVIIGQSVARSIAAKLERLDHQGVPVANEVVVLGYGAVGRASALFLKSMGHTVRAYDTRPDAMARARADGVETFATREDALRSGHVLVSATGRTTIDASDESLLPDRAILVNAASGDTEIDLSSLKDAGSEALLGVTRVRFAGRSVTVHDRRADVAPPDRVKIGANGRERYLVNGGAVVNFTGETDPIEPRLIQMTRALMYLGAVQAAGSTAPGWHALDERGQEELQSGLASEYREARGL